MSDPYVRTTGHVTDLDGREVPVGVDYDAVVIGPYRFTSAAFGELFAELFSAAWDAARHAGQMAAGVADRAEPFHFITDEGADFLARAVPGQRVRYANPDAGYEADRARAAAILTPGAAYVITGTDIRSSVSYLYLDGVQGRFNSVLFEISEEEAGPGLPVVPPGEIDAEVAADVHRLTHPPAVPFETGAPFRSSAEIDWDDSRDG